MLLCPTEQPDVESDEFRRRMIQAGQAIRDGGVEAVYMLHGTFSGADGFGVLRDLEMIFPGLGRLFAGSRGRSTPVGRLVGKTIATASIAAATATAAVASGAVSGTRGSFTQDYAQQLEFHLHEPGYTPLPVRMFFWNGQNHHVGRADAAVHLLYDLLHLKLPANKRVLLLGHSHGGNVFAILTNLLAADPETRWRFFDAARAYYRVPIIGKIDRPIWEKVEKLLQRPGNPLADKRLDFVTFGTPIRYGWDSDGYNSLTHFVNHRPVPGMPPYLSPFPRSVKEVLRAASGDYVHLLGVAGSNIFPSVVDPRTWVADCKLRGILQPGVRSRQLLARIKSGMRVAADGTSLLVDYGPPTESIAVHHGGHSVYVRQEWMLFHAEEIARRVCNAMAIERQKVV